LALILLNPGTSPLGQFDGYTGVNGAGSGVTAFKGGEICTWQQQTFPALGAQDVNDGYTWWGGGYGGTPVQKVVPAISMNWSLMYGQSAMHGPYFLSDDGTLGYGTLFGTVVGGAVGSQANGPFVSQVTGSVLGPHTALGSGKVTVWDKQGLYAVTADAVDTTAVTGLIPSNTNLSVGSPISFTGNGLLTTINNRLSPYTPTVARLADFSTNGSYVTTPQSLVAALNSPSGDVTSVSQLTFTQVVFWYAGAQGGESLGVGTGSDPSGGYYQEGFPTGGPTGIPSGGAGF
jgi:hypothetical protein